MRTLLRGLWKSVGISGVIAAIVSACLMTLEIIAGHLLAPFVGVSIVPWASVIAIVMVAMAVGYYAGGVVARKDTSLRKVGMGVVVAALWVACMSPLAHWMGAHHVLASAWSLGVNALVLSVGLLFVPSCLLAAVHPCLVAHVATEHASTGRAIGTLNAVAAIGSIIGTFFAGFVWLMWVTLPTIFLVTAFILALVGIGMTLMQGRTRQAPSSASRTYPEWQHALLSGISGFVLMSLEVVAARALAPHIGVSIFTWTGVIGAVLIGITLGNTLGGVLADREGLHVRLGRTIAWAGVAVLFSVCLIEIGGPIFAAVSLPLALRTALFALVAFLPPSFALAAISPQLVKVATSESQNIGSVAGMLSAWNTLGGLVGSLATGFVLISWMGTRTLLASLAALLMIAGAVYLRPHRPWKRRVSVLIALVFAMQALVPRACLLETQYYCIQILDDAGSTPENPRYLLRLDHLVHSYVHLHHPETLGYGYEQVYAHLIATRHKQDDAFSSLFIGGGGYVLPRYLEARYPGAKSVVTEIDPQVTETNHAHFGLSRNTTIETYNIDARMYVSREADKKSFEFVFGDAFNDFSVPYHLTTVEFHRLLKSRMSTSRSFSIASLTVILP
jgi:predicted membrane-bound spermidine synthase